jgi:hypothetical protein
MAENLVKNTNTSNSGTYTNNKSDTFCSRRVQKNDQIFDDRLISVRNIALLLKYVLISHYIKIDIAPLSLFLIAPSEHNKTRILLNFKKFPFTLTVENLSAKPLNDLIKEQGKRRTVRHIIVLDIIRVLQQKTKTADAVISTLLNLTDEGSQNSLFFGQKYHLKHRITMGIATAITPPLFRKHFRVWNQNGALTRWLFCSYHYTQATNKLIKKYITENLPYMANEAIAKCKIRKKQTITIPHDIACAIQVLSEEIEKRLKTFYVEYTYGEHKTRIYLDMQGFRLLKMLRLLAMSIAYDRERNEVNYEDLVTLRELADLIRLPDNPKEI